MTTSRTVRFREDHPAEQKALLYLQQYRDFGFQSGNELIIAAINKYCSQLNSGDNSPNLIQEIRSAVREEMRALQVQAVPQISASQPSTNTIVSDTLSAEDEADVLDFLNNM